ncbi:ABC1K8 [Symbiodinium sp. CCMP2592]|nr:ABC1K8 [Symbiodinium sp. CCMP2592]
MSVIGPAWLQQDVLYKEIEDRHQKANEIVDFCTWIYFRDSVSDSFFLFRGLKSWMPDSWVQAVNDRQTLYLSWEERHYMIAQTLFNAALKMGGLPLKAMQMVSLRDDLPLAYREVFRAAQESTDFRSPADHVEGILKSLQPHLTNVSLEPIKSASIAQVHAGLWEGSPCILKIQHPHIKAVYKADLQIMVELADKVNAAKEGVGASVMLRAVAAKLEPMIDEETDFMKEAENQCRAKANFVENQSIVVAKVYRSDQMFLLMEKLEGITGAEAEARWAVGDAVDVFGPAQRTVLYEAYAEMLFKHRFLQADAHPGNFLALPSGQVGLLDFGQTTEINPQTHERFLSFAKNAPRKPVDPDDHQSLMSLKTWLIGVGVEVENGLQAQRFAEIFFYGGDGTIFAEAKSIDPATVAALIVVMYLSRFENTANRTRARLGMTDAPSPRTSEVLEAWRRVADLF